MASSRRPALKSAQTVTGATSEPEETPSTSDQMGAEARSEKAKKPKKSPQLWPFAQLPRRRRAQFFAPLRGVDPDALSQVSDGGERLSLDTAADTFELLASIEDSLRVVAVPDSGVDFDEWASACSDEDLMGLFQWYMDRFNPGEAKPSSS